MPEKFIPKPGTERIVSAAMKMKDGLIVMGTRHFSADMHAVLNRLYPGQQPKLLVQAQGFIDQYGQFYSREEAWKVAEKQGQIRGNVTRPGKLFSEDIY